MQNSNLQNFDFPKNDISSPTQKLGYCHCLVIRKIISNYLFYTGGVFHSFVSLRFTRDFTYTWLDLARCF